MDSYIRVGKIVNTFGIKGELKIVSDFEYRDKVFKKDFIIYIGEEKNKEVINEVRVHKNNELVLLSGYSNINEVLKYIDKIVYINRNDLILLDNEYLLNDLVGLEVYDKDELLGVVIDYEYSGNGTLLKVHGNKDFYLPNIEEYIDKVSIKNRRIDTKEGKKLII